MKIFQSATLLLYFLACSTVYAQHKAMVLMTYNIRFDNPDDGENRWEKRRVHVAQTIQFYDVQICGMQEALKGQIDDLIHLLPGFAYVGVGRDDGKDAGEFSPIFYDSTRLKLLESHTFWLSPTPKEVSKGWDAALPRIATWAKFKDRNTKRVFFVFNSHFDHIGRIARKESAELLIRQMRLIAGKRTAFLMGDFNSPPEDEPAQLLQQAFRDCKTASRTPHFGPESTFNGFSSSEKEGMRIDYIFYNDPAVQVWKHATISQTWAGRFASDHHAVMTIVRF